ncbi:MAG: hypothetical protein WCD42_02825 [Rhizomicrobium sp.]
MLAAVVAALALCGGIVRAAPAQPACADLERAVAAHAGTGAVFLASYPTVKDGPLQGAAFLYDNAAAVIALQGCGAPDQARRIGDGLLAALERDPFWHDGRLRNAYAAGVVAPGPVKPSGWWDKGQNKWVEDAYQTASDSGNLAWAMLALLALDRTAAENKRGDRRYLQGAERLAGWLAERWDGEGFTGGFLGFEPTPQKLTWKSVEHNTDLAAAFRLLAARTGDARWRMVSRRAESFVAAMWNPALKRYDAGSDQKKRDITPALDAQLWPVLTIAGAHRADVHRFAALDGYAYGAAKGVWTEGTAQAALFMAYTGNMAAYRRLLIAVEKRHDPNGFYRAADKNLATGFQLAADPSVRREFFPLPHLGATAWAALAETRFNPFTQMTVPAP